MEPLCTVESSRNGFILTMVYKGETFYLSKKNCSLKNTTSFEAVKNNAFSNTIFLFTNVADKCLFLPTKKSVGTMERFISSKEVFYREYQRGEKLDVDISSRRVIPVTESKTISFKER